MIPGSQSAEQSVYHWGQKLFGPNVLMLKKLERVQVINMKKIIATKQAPAAIGPYSQAVEVNGLLFTSGVIPIIPETGELVDGGIEAQAEQAIGNLAALVQASGASLENTIKTTVFIKNMDDFALVNEIYAKYFTKDFPARSCVEVARLPKDVLIEIEAIVEK